MNKEPYTISPEFVEHITALAKPANPSDVQLYILRNAWEVYFYANSIKTEHQKDEFNRIMTARVQGGSISLVAPKTGIEIAKDN